MASESEDPLVNHKPEPQNTPEDESRNLGNSSSQSNINRKRCRTCLKAVDTDRTSFYNIDTNDLPSTSNSAVTIMYKLYNVLPELDELWDIIPNTIICSFCEASLHRAYEFRQRCLKTTGSILDYRLHEVKDGEDVELEKVVVWNNDREEKRLEFVEVLVNDNNAEWNSDGSVNFTCINPSTKVEVNVTKEPLMGEGEVEETSEGNFSEEIKDNNVKLEEIQVKDEMHSTDAKLNEDDIQAANDSVEGERIQINQSVPFSSEDKAYECNECQVQFSLECDYRLHKALRTQNLKPYECDECEFSTPNQKSLRRHLLVNHTKELKCRCRSCGLETTCFDRHDMIACNKKNIKDSKRRNKGKKPELQTYGINSNLGDYRSRRQYALNMASSSKNA